MDHVERIMRRGLLGARKSFEYAKELYDHFHGTEEEKLELWKRFNATERRLMKDSDGAEWS